MYTLFYNGHIHTGVEAQPYCRTVLIQSNHIIFCGDDQDINIPNKLINKVDLKNAHVYPVFIDVILILPQQRLLRSVNKILVRATNVLMTIIGGKIVYRADSI